MKNKRICDILFGEKGLEYDANAMKNGMVPQ
jgi:hypothetical protein